MTLHNRALATFPEVSLDDSFVDRLRLEQGLRLGMFRRNIVSSQTKDVDTGDPYNPENSSLG